MVCRRWNCRRYATAPCRNPLKLRRYTALKLRAINSNRAGGLFNLCELSILHSKRHFKNCSFTKLASLSAVDGLPGMAGAWAQTAAPWLPSVPNFRATGSKSCCCASPQQSPLINQQLLRLWMTSAVLIVRHFGFPVHDENNKYVIIILDWFWL